MTLFEHPLWPTLLGFLYIRMGKHGLNGPRHRIEVNHHAPVAVFDMEVECAYCGRLMNPVRLDARGAWTFNVSCPLAVRVKCARMPQSTAMAKAVRAAMQTAPPPAWSLF